MVWHVIISLKYSYSTFARPSGVFSLDVACITAVRKDADWFIGSIQTESLLQMKFLEKNPERFPMITPWHQHLLWLFYERCCKLELWFFLTRTFSLFILIYFLWCVVLFVWFLCVVCVFCLPLLPLLVPQTAVRRSTKVSLNTLCSKAKHSGNVWCNLWWLCLNWTFHATLFVIYLLNVAWFTIRAKNRRDCIPQCIVPNLTFTILVLCVLSP